MRRDVRSVDSEGQETLVTQPASFSPPVAPDPAQAIAFFKALFPSEGYVHFRAVPEPKDDVRRPTNHWYEIDAKFPEVLAQFLDYCNVESRAAFFLPALARPGKSHKDAVVSLPCFLVDFDKGNPAEGLAQIEALVGPATAIVESGGATSTGSAKLHAYWKLDAPAAGTDIAKVCALREQLAAQYGGDPSFKQEAQVIRIPGSVHFKNGARPVTLRTLRPTVHYGLAGLPVEPSRVSDTGKSEAAPAPSNVVNFFDFSRDRPDDGADVTRALSQPILSEGASPDRMTRFEGAGKAIGHFIRLVREGTLPDLNAAWERVLQWNETTMVPPWSEDRLKEDFRRLIRLDIQEKGPVVPVIAALPSTQAAGWNVVEWKADRFVGEAPARRWLVDGLIPQSTAGVFAAVGDAGKSMLALKLALMVATYPPPDPLGIGTPRFFGCPVVARGSAVILTAEDDADEVHRRLNGLDPTSARLGKPLFVVPMISAGGARAVLTDSTNGPMPTQFWWELRAQLLAIPDLKLVVLDPLSSFVGADVNDNTVGAALMAMLAELAATTGAVVILVHHLGKSIVPTSLSDARTAIRGASALVDNGRWSLVLWEAERDDRYKVLKALGQQERAKEVGTVYFGGLAKGNAPSAKVIRPHVRNAKTGLLEDVTDALAAAAPRSDEMLDRLYAALRSHAMEQTNWSFPIGRKSAAQLEWALEKAGLEAISPNKLEALLKELRKNGLLVPAQKPAHFEINFG